MNYIKLYEDFDSRDNPNFDPTSSMMVLDPGYEEAWEKYKKSTPNWVKDLDAAYEKAVELALTYYKDPDEAERAAAVLFQSKNEPDNKLK